jgi:hypothetical protein
LVCRFSAKDLEERRKKMSMLSTLSDLSRRTSCVSAVSSLQLEPPLRRQSAAATPPPPCRQSTAGGTPANSTLVQRRPQQHQLQVYLGPKIVQFDFFLIKSLFLEKKTL